MKLVTIVTESLARPLLVRLLAEIGAQGYTIVAAAGSGARGERPGDIEDFSNIKVEVILPEPAAIALFDRLASDFFPRFTTVAYQSDIQVVRPHKF